MTTALALRADTPIALQMTDAEIIPVLRSSLYPGASDASIKLVIGYCKATGLDPMMKPVHIVPMWDKNSKSMRDVIMPGIGKYRTDAARTGQLAGIGEPEFGPEVNYYGTTAPEWCRVTVKRLIAGVERDFVAKEYWIENYATAGKDSDAPNNMWRKRPRGQIAKCAEAQALRKGFPEATGSEPTAEEMEGRYEVDMDTGEVTGRKPAVAMPVAKVKQAQAQADTEKTATNSVAPEGVTDVTPKGEPAPANPPASDDKDRPASAGEIKFIEGKLKRMGLDITQALEAIGSVGDTLDGITLSQFNALKALKAPQ